MKFKKVMVGDNYMERWHLIPRNKYLNIYLHHFIGDDNRGELHDHPWWFLSVLLKGKLLETELCDGKYKTHRIPWLWPRWYPHHHIHRLMLPRVSPDAWSLVITGPRKYLWGFYTNTVRTTIMNNDDFKKTDDKETAAEKFEPDYNTPCDICGNVPTVTSVKDNVVTYHSGLCGPCCFGNADCLDPINW